MAVATVCTSSRVSGTPARPAIARRWTTAFVEPPTAARTVRALWKASAVRTAEGEGPPATAISTARRPLATPWRSRSPVGEGGDAPPGSIMPSASVTQAIVEAVPITMHVPPVVQRRPSISAISPGPISPARCAAHILRQSVQAPRRSPRQSPVSMGPVTVARAGTSADAAAMSCAGTVLSQPPTSTTASMGWARTSSSVAIAARLRYSIDVGERRISARDGTGKASGRPPASSTPRRTASTSWGMSR